MIKDSGKVNIHGKEYETVASRVKRLREDHNFDIAIQTEIIAIDEDVVVMKASAVKDGIVIGTGHAEENRQASTINKTSALENCETSAIGRCLANIGYLGTEFASADEVAHAIAQQGKPVTDRYISLKQIQLLGNKLKWGFNAIKEFPESDELRVILAEVLGKEVNTVKMAEMDEAIAKVDSYVKTLKKEGEPQEKSELDELPY